MVDKIKINKNKSDYKLRERAKRKVKLLRYLKNKKCVDCQEDDPIVLEFDHVRGLKKSNIATLINDCKPWKDISLEIKKCDIRCANCHRRKTAKDLGFWKQVGVGD